MMLHAEPQSNIKDRIRLHYYLRDHLGNTVVAFDDRNYDGAVSDVEEGTQSKVIGRYHYYSFGERGCSSHTKWLVAEVKRSVCPAGRLGRSRSDSEVITLHAGRHEVLMRKQWNHAWAGSDIGGYWQQRYRYNGKEMHSNSGLLDYGFRYYRVSAEGRDDPSVQRFTGACLGIACDNEMDPCHVGRQALAEEMPGWSPYNYVFNNPLLLVDPLGLAPEPPDDFEGNDYKDESGSYSRNSSTEPWVVSISGAEDGAYVGSVEVVGSKAKSGGGGLETTKNVLGALDVSQGAKAGIINYASKADASINDMKYVKGLKVASKGLFAAQAGMSLYQAGNAFYTNNVNKWGVARKAGLEVTIGYISLVGGPIGWEVGAVYFIGDAAGWWGNWGQAAPTITPLEINKS